MNILTKIFNAIFGAVFPRKDADVYAILAERAKGKEHLFDWRNSIVDLLKLLELDSSFVYRQELAKELGIEGYAGTAQQNTQLHQAVMNKVKRRELG